MKTLIRGTLKRPVTVVVAIIGLIIFAGMSLLSIPMKLLPDMTVPYMLIMAPYPGASPEEVDRLVTDPIESACNSISGLDFSQTQSMENFGYVIMAFEYGTNMDKAYDDVKVALDTAKMTLPDDVKDPTVMELSMDSVPDMTITAKGTSDDVDVLQAVNEKIIPEIKKVSSVARVQTSGGDEKYIQVKLIPEYMDQYGLSIASVASAITAVNFSTPAGTTYYGDQHLTMKAEAAYETVSELEQVPITTSKGQVIHLSDVAVPSYAIADKASISRYNGLSSVTMSITRKQSDSAVTMSREVLASLDRIKQNHPELEFNVTYNSAENITDTLASVGKTVAEAVLLAMLILFLFFGDLKASLIVGSTMPISILATFSLMRAAGFDLNIVSLGALMIAVGMMTDNAVVVIEMCFRKRDEGMDFRDAAYAGAITVMNSVAGSTVTTVVVYLPISLMEGLSAQLFKPLGFTIIFALVSSLISALTLIPLCFSRYKPVERKRNPVNRLINWISSHYERILKKALDHKKIVLLFSVTALILTFWASRFLKTELYNSPDEGSLSVTAQFRPNLSLEIRDEEMKKLEEFAASDPDIKNYSISLSNEESSGSMSAYVRSGVKTQSVVDRWNDSLKGFSNLGEFTASVGGSFGGTSSGSSLEYDISGTDLKKVQADSFRIVEVMENTPGVLRASSSLRETGSQISVKIDPVMAQAHGFSTQQLAGLIHSNMNGSEAAKVSIDRITYSIKVEWPEDYFRTVSNVQSMTFTNPSGVSVPLTEMAQISVESAPEVIYREDGLYFAEIVATVPSAQADSLREILDEKIYAIELDKSVSFKDNAEDRIMATEFSALGSAIFIAIFLVFAVMAIQFESVASSLLIMMCLPFALVGSILLLLVMQLKISMTSLMGILMLSGIVVNNGIILIDMTLQNRNAGMQTREALISAGTGRMRPIFMTSLTTILAMVPTATGIPKGSETLQGMSVVIVGGLLASTVLALILLPSFYLIIDNIKERRRERRRNRKRLWAFPRKLLPVKESGEEDGQNPGADPETEADAGTEAASVEEPETEADAGTEAPYVEEPETQAEEIPEAGDGEDDT